jgi:hypothetical protein
MSRLLFAAARGARIECKNVYGEWDYAVGAYKILREQADYYRIHPDNEHLQYGPISSALREFALRGENFWSNDIDAAFAYVDYLWPSWCKGLGGDDYLTTLLFMAEALADEGL